MKAPFTFMTSGDVARALDLSSSMVRILVHVGRLRPTARTHGGVRLFDPDDVERLRQERERRRVEVAL